MKDEPDVEIPVLLSTTDHSTWFLDHKVSCARQPLKVYWSYWEDIANEELAEALAFAGHTGATAGRILKGKEKTSTSMFKVTFNTSTLPTFVHLEYQGIQVNPFTAKPWQ